MMKINKNKINIFIDKYQLLLLMQILFETDKFKWINIQNPTKQELNEVASQYCFQKLTIDDSLEPGHLPKYESDDENISFLLVRFLTKNIEC